MINIRFPIFRIACLLLLCDISFAQQEACPRTNCTKTIRNLQVSFASYKKTQDMKYVTWTAVQTSQVSGSQEERERACAKKCMKDGRDFCKSAHLSPYSESSASTCELFKEDVYGHWQSVLSGLRSDSPGWTSFHLLVKQTN